MTSEYPNPKNSTEPGLPDHQLDIFYNKFYSQMMNYRNSPDLTGRRLGKWTILKRGEKNKYGAWMWLCRCDCGTERSVVTSNLLRPEYPSRSCRKRGCNSGNTWIEPNGYVSVWMPNHPNAPASGKLALHVIIMSNYIGRPLTKEETVHHKNGVRDDNRIENLELWSTSQPAGQRVSEKLNWAKEIIRLYEPIEKVI